MATSSMTPDSVKGKRGGAVEAGVNDLLGFMGILGDGLPAAIPSLLTVRDHVLVGEKVTDGRTDDVWQGRFDALLDAAR